jgi:beta-glucosidase
MENMSKTKEEIQMLIDQMTLEEKASLCSGSEMFRSTGIERLGIPAFNLSDGPHGLRKQEGKQDFMGQNVAVTATCFPATCLTGSSFDPSLVNAMGHALGKIAQSKDVQVLLGPGINHKRSPLCGRNFEYFSEDPFLSGTLGTAYIKGVQSEGVGVSVKHFIANNQETRRRTTSSNMDERTLYEIYAPAFEKVVQETKPWSVMTSYNKFHGTYVNETSALCKDLLRRKWGFEGMVVSDWTAVHNRVKALKGGTELTMPDDKDNDHQIVDAVKHCTLSMQDLDDAVYHICSLAFQAEEAKKKNAEYDFEEAHVLAKKIAAESMVLLKNTDEILPLNPQKKIAIVGCFAENPRYQGTGSSHVNAWDVKKMSEVTAEYPNIIYAEGYGKEDIIDDAKEAEAIQSAEKSDIAVVIAGLPEVMEGEGYDRWTMKLPKCQNHLIERICETQPNTIVVMENGGCVEMPWAEKPKAILEAYLAGEAVNEAVFDVLTGKTAPSGHLAETFPLHVEDNPSYLSFPGDGDESSYPEGVFTGYRYYTTKKAEVRYPFGYGLTYTSFEYHDISLDASVYQPGAEINASVSITNTGRRAGKTVVQLYVGSSLRNTGIHRPIRELKGFEKIALQPGETKQVTFKLGKRDFAFYDPNAHDWRVAGGTYNIEIGTDANSIVLSAPVTAEEEYIASGINYNILTPICDVKKNPAGQEFFHKYQPMIDAVIKRMTGGAGTKMKLPYAEECPAEMGLNSEPMQTIKRMLPMISAEEWKIWFEKMNEAK